jgi:hypothetical protein
MLAVMIFSVAISLAFALWCRVVARRRGLDVTWWAVFGFAPGPFALPFVYLAKKRGA